MSVVMQLQLSLVLKKGVQGSAGSEAAAPLNFRCQNGQFCPLCECDGQNRHFCPKSIYSFHVMSNIGRTRLR